MEANCYICNNKAKNWSQNLVEIKSKHSRTPIAEFVSKFLDDYPTDRDLYHYTNCICIDCLSKIYAYDWTCIKAKEQETELRNLLLRTESVMKSLQFEGSYDTNESKGPVNPLNGVVHIIDDEDYNNGDPMDDKANVKVEMPKYSTSESTSAAEPEIQMTPVVKMRKTSSIIDIKPDPTTICDMKPTIEKPSQTQAQPQPKKVIPKGKPIIVRVVKRVPFLKTNPSNATSQPNTATTTTTTSSSGPSNANGTSPKPAQQTAVKTIVVKKTALGKQTTVCKYCDGRFPNVEILQVSISSNYHFGFSLLFSDS